MPAVALLCATSSVSRVVAWRQAAPTGSAAAQPDAEAAAEVLF